MEQPAKYAWLDEFLDSADKALGYMDLATLQPTSWQHFHPLIAKEWLAWFENVIDEREKQRVPFGQAALVLQAGWLRTHLLFTMEDVKAVRQGLEQRLKHAEFFHEVLKAEMPQGDLFGLNGTTRLHSKEQAEKLAEQEFQAGTPEAARALGKLYNAAYNLGAGLYLDFYMDKAIENFGSYDLGDGRVLVIKDMRFLKPTEVWPQIGTCADKLRLYAIYEGVKFSTDMIACHTQYQGNPINGLKHWRLEKDGKPVSDIAEINEVATNLATVGKNQWIAVTTMPEQELLEKAVELRCFVFKPLCDLLKINWKPTTELLKAVHGKTLRQGFATWKPPKTKQARKKYWRKIWDPRVEAYP